MLLYIFQFFLVFICSDSQNYFSKLNYIYIAGPTSRSFKLSAGRYRVTCCGAQGGYSHENGYISAIGGLGANVSAYIVIEGEPQLFHAFVGGMGGSRNTGLADGGYNGGGMSGWNKKWKAHTFHNKQYKNGPGGGGGATDLRFGTNDIMDRIIVAAGGSGGCFNTHGAPGGELSGYNAWGVSPNTNQQIGYSYGTGANGATAKRYPSSGGGGGYIGGIAGNPSEYESLSPISNSGSSYISGYPGCTPHPKITLDSGKMVAGYKAGHGELIIDIVYQCPDSCLKCTGENQCILCSGLYRLYNGKCYSTCPAGTIDRNYYCEKCDDSCLDCSETVDNCTACADDYFEYNGNCISQCPNGYYEYEKKCLSKCIEGTYAKGSICTECSYKCKDCVDEPEKCTACSYGEFLLNGKCVDSCPDRYVIQGNVCIGECDSNHFLYQNFCYDICPKGTYQTGNTCKECDSSCAECRNNPTSCTACYKDKYLFNSQCILNCTEDYYTYHSQCLISCPPNTFMSGKNCVDYCPEGKYGINQICDDCDSVCAACKNTPTTCTKCNNNTFLYNNKCIDECIDGTYIYLNECVDQCPPGTQLKDKICLNSIDYYNQNQTTKGKKKYHFSKAGDKAYISVSIIIFMFSVGAVIFLAIRLCDEC